MTAVLDLRQVERSLDLVRRALVLGTATLVRRPAELAAQLAGRLAPGAAIGVDGLLSQLAERGPDVWLQPVYPSLRHAGDELVCTLEGHEAPVRAAVFTSDDRVVSGSEDGTVRVWDTRAGRPMHALWHGTPITTIGLSADQRMVLAVGADGSATTWDLEHGERAGEHRVPDGWSGAEMSLEMEREMLTFTLCHQDRDADGRPQGTSAAGDIVVVGTDEVWAREKSDVAWGTVEVEDRRSGRRASLHGHRGTVRAVAITADGSVAVSRDENDVVWIWDLEGSSSLLSVQGAGGAVAVSRSGLVLTSGSDGTIRVWAPTTGGTHLGHQVPVSAVALAEAAGIAVSLADHGQEHLWLWDLSGASPPRHRWVDSKEASAVAVSRDGRWAVAGYEAGQMFRWSLDADPTGKDTVYGNAGWASGPFRYEDIDVARDSWAPTHDIAVSDDGACAISRSGPYPKTADDLRREIFEDGVAPPEGMWQALEAALEARREHGSANRSWVTISGPTISVEAPTGNGGPATFTVDGSQITAWDAAPGILVVGDDTGSVHVLHCHGLDE